MRRDTARGAGGRLTNGVRGDLNLDLTPCRLIRDFSVADRKRPLRCRSGRFTISVGSMRHVAFSKGGLLCVAMFSIVGNAVVVCICRVVSKANRKV